MQGNLPGSCATLNNPIKTSQIVVVTGIAAAATLERMVKLKPMANLVRQGVTLLVAVRASSRHRRIEDNNSVRGGKVGLRKAIN